MNSTNVRADGTARLPHRAPYVKLCFGWDLRDSPGLAFQEKFDRCSVTPAPDEFRGEFLLPPP